jgi:hypothetical protein
MVDGEAGKGDSYRPADYKKWCRNWTRCFKKLEKQNAHENTKRVRHHPDTQKETP